MDQFIRQELQKKVFEEKEKILKKLDEKKEIGKRWEENAKNLREIAEHEAKQKAEKAQ